MFTIMGEIFIEDIGPRISFRMIISHSVNGEPLNPHSLEEHGLAINFDLFMTKKRFSPYFL